MNKILLFFSLIILFSCSGKKEALLTTEIACGQCQFEMTSQGGCDLAVKIDGESYFVDGFNIDDFGDAHAKHTGFCEVIRKGKATGKIVNNRFEMESLEFMEPDSVVTH